MSRYDALTEALRSSDEPTIVLTFGELDRIVGGLPNSAKKYGAWWANSRSSQAHAKAWLDAGRRASPDFRKQEVVFTAGRFQEGGSPRTRSSRQPETLLRREAELVTSASSARAGVAATRPVGANLMERTIQLLDSAPKSLPDVASDLGISYYWLRKFKSGEIKDPSVNKVQHLYEYLTGEPLLK